MAGKLHMAAALCAVIGCGKGEPSETPPQTPGTDTKAKVEAEIAKVTPDVVGDDARSSNFAVESAKIVYRLTGMEEGTVTAWFSGHGDTVVLYREMTKPIAEKRHIVWKDGKATMWSHGEKPSTMKLRPRDTELRLVSTNDPKQLEMAGYEKKPNAEIAGMDTEVWHREASNVTFWRWQGVDLKYINGVSKRNPPILEAIEVVSPAEIPADMIGPPSTTE